MYTLSLYRRSVRKPNAPVLIVIHRHVLLQEPVAQNGVDKGRALLQVGVAVLGGEGELSDALAHLHESTRG